MLGQAQESVQLQSQEQESVQLQSQEQESVQLQSQEHERVQLQSQEQESVQLQSMLLAVFASCNFPRIIPCCFFETSTKYLSFIPAPVARS